MKPLFIQSSKGRPQQKAGASNSSTSDMTPTLTSVHEAIVACERCPRLRHYCREIARVKKRAHQHDTYWGRPVPGFGDPAARLLLIALAPAAHGANRTGWSSQDLVDTLSAWPVSRFELIGAHAAEITVATCLIVERLDVVGHIG